MYEEDRVRALEEYEDIFEQAGNENAVLQMLVSPTRQAVNLARAYDAKDRGSLAEGGEGPAYLGVIDELRRQVGTIIPAAPVINNDDQISIFDEPDVAESIFDSIDLGALPEQEEDDGQIEELSAEIDLYPDEDRTAEAAIHPAAPERTAPTAETPNSEVDEFSDAVAAFLADFTVRKEGEKTSFPTQPAENGEEEAPEPLPDPAMDSHDEDRQMPAEAKKPVQTPSAGTDAGALDTPAPTKSKPNAALLILYILIAIPVTLLLIALLLVPAVLCLALAAVGLCLGVAGVVEAFTAFSVFADMLLVFGIALALAALGLLLFWCFVWFLAGAVPGVIRGACRLGRKLCYREVPA